MNLDGFSSYDLIADVIPGAVLLSSLLTIVPGYHVREMFALGSDAYAAGLFIIGSFVAGRVVHAIGSLEADRGSKNEDAEIEKLLNTEEDDISSPVFMGARTAAVERIKQTPQGRIGIYEEDDKQLELRKRGESLLYGTGSLYSKYEAIATFYRNLMVAAAFGCVSFLTTGVLTSSDPPLVHTVDLWFTIIGIFPVIHMTVADRGSELLVDQSGMLILGGIGLGGLAILSRCKWNHWNERKAPAFINDLASLPPSDAEHR